MRKIETPTLSICTVLLSVIVSLFVSFTSKGAYCAHKGYTVTTWDATCVFDGFEVMYCEFCHSYVTTDIPATGHKMSEWIVYAEPDCSTHGEKYRLCTICEIEKETAKIPPTRIHKWGKWKSVKKSSYSKTGKERRECQNCIKSQSRKIPKLKFTKKERAVVNAFKKYISHAKKYNSAKLTECFASPAEDLFFNRKKYMVSYCQKYNKKISYTIEKISVNGKHADIKARIKSPDAYSAFKASFDDAIWHLALYPDSSDDEFNEYLKQRISYYSKLYGVKTKTRTIKFQYAKSNQGWKIKKATTSIIDIANCMYEKAYNDYFAQYD